jgi:hypothetical protein
MMDCLAEPCCRSINYKYSSLQNEPNKCEFLHDLVENTTSVLEANTSFDYVYFTEAHKVNNVYLVLLHMVYTLPFCHSGQVFP